MPPEFKIYKIKNLIRKDESGELSREKIEGIIKKLSTAAALHPDHNILLDFRQTTLSEVGMVDILTAAMEIERFKEVLTNRIANVIPSDKNRISIAEKTEAAFQLKGIQYKFFTHFEDAIEWLSDVTVWKQTIPTGFCAPIICKASTQHPI